MRRYLQAAALGLVLALPTFARADDAKKAEAQARFNEGIKLADGGKWEEARNKFLQSLSMMKAAATLFNLAAAEQKTAHELEAIEHYRAFLQVAETDPRITDPQRDKARAAIAELLKKVGQIDVRAPVDATISVDGKALAAAPTEPIPVSPGRHTVEGSRNGALKTVVVEPAAGQIVLATIELGEATAPPAAPAPAPGGDPGSSWTTARIVTVGALAAVAVTGGVLSFVFHGKAQDDVDEAKAKLQGRSCVGVTGNADCTAASQLKDDRDSKVTLSTVSLVGGVAFGVGAVAAAVLWPKSKEQGGARVVPVGAPGYGGLSVVGGF